jgi:predicted DCC family thiol-disulfide oxidoreductase YuxK
MEKAPAVVLYDGDCGFCSENAMLGRKYQRPGALEWLDNGSARAKALLAERGLSGKEEETLIVLEGERAYLFSDAVVRSAQGLRWPWRLYAGIRFLPRAWREAWYRRLAADRDKHGCHLPPAAP